MRNVLAIAQKELRAYFVSPIAYVAIGIFAVLFGYFYVASLSILLQVSMQSGMFGAGGPQTININEFMVRPLLSNTAVILLLFLPFLTARAYAEEKRSGTIELLMTSPLTDLQILLGKFLGALTLFRRDARRDRDPHGRPVLVRRTGARADPDRVSGARADGRLVHLGRTAGLERDAEPDRGRGHHVRRAAPVLGHQLDGRLDRADDAVGLELPVESSSTSTTSRRASSTPSTSSTT